MGHETDPVALLGECTALAAQIVALGTGHLDRRAALLDRLIAAHRGLAACWSVEPSTLAGFARALTQRAWLHEMSGATGEARALRAEAAACAGSLPPMERARIDVESARERFDEGRFHEALTALFEAREVIGRGGDARATIECGLQLAELLLLLGDVERAEASLLEVEAPLGDFTARAPSGWMERMAHSLAARSLQATRLRGLIRCADLRGDPERTAALCRELAALGGGFRDEEAWVRTASALTRAGRFDDAMPLWEKAIDALRGDAAAGVVLSTLLSRASRCALSQGRIEVALARGREAVALADVREDLDARWKAHAALGLSQEAAHPAEALEHMALACEVIQGLRRAPLGPRLDGLFLHDKREVFDHAVTLAAARGDGARCASLIDAVKSRELAAAMGAPRAADDPADARIDATTRALDGLELDPGASGDDDRARRRRTLLAERDALIEGARITEARWRALLAPVPLRLDATLAALARRRSALLTLHFDGRRVVAVLLYEGAVTASARPLTDAVLSALSAHDDNLRAASPDRDAYDLSAHTGIDAADLLPKALLDDALRAERLVVSPHRALHAVPWSTLRYGATRLFERLPVGVLPNVACVLPLEGLASGPPTASLLGAPEGPMTARWPRLTAAKDELDRLATLYARAGRLAEPACMGVDATASALAARLTRGASGTLLHLACHARFDDDDPSRSALVLADGMVDLATLQRARVRHDEVVLSACQTGYRPSRWRAMELAGDEIAGLPGALLEAGARSVLASVTPAQDEVAQAFMTSYHRARLKGAPPLEALRTTQRSMLDAGVEPSRWCGFAVYGWQ